MKILSLAAYCYPEETASSHLGRNKDEAYNAEGFYREIYAPTPTRGINEETYKKYKKIKFETLDNGLTTIHRFSMFREGKNPFQRAFRYFLCWLFHLYYGLRSKNCDLLLLGSTPPIQGLLGAYIKRYKRIPFIYILQDIFPDSLVGTGLTNKGSLIWKIGRWIEDRTYKSADKIIVISQDFKKNIIAKGVPEEKIEVIYNWVDEQAVVDVPRSENKLFDKYNLDRTKFYITYSGNIGMTQNMDMLLSVMEDLIEEAPNVYLIIIGEGAYKEKVKGIVEEKKLTNVILLPFQPYEDISHVFSLGNAGVVISKPGVGANSVPSKTWSIMSASRPVLANFDENELKDIIENNKCGIFTKAGDKEAFKASILEFYHNKELCKEYGKNGRQFVMNNLTKERGTRKYVDVIKSLVSY